MNWYFNVRNGKLWIRYNSNENSFLESEKSLPTDKDNKIEKKAIQEDIKKKKK